MPDVQIVSRKPHWCSQTFFQRCVREEKLKTIIANRQERTKKEMESESTHDSFSSPNLTRHRQTGRHQTNYRPSGHLVPTPNRWEDHRQPADLSISSLTAQDNGTGDEKDDGSGGKMSRSERKRMWRKNLSAEKLAKLRERDALRKRMERMNMSAEKRRDLRTKDTARKAALRRERRMSESVPVTNNYSSTAAETLLPDNHADKESRTLRIGEFSGDVSRSRERKYDPQSRTGRDRHHRSSDPRATDDKFNKIPVQSLLN